MSTFDEALGRGKRTEEWFLGEIGISGYTVKDIRGGHSGVDFIISHHPVKVDVKLDDGWIMSPAKRFGLAVEHVSVVGSGVQGWVYTSEADLIAFVCTKERGGWPPVKVIFIRLAVLRGLMSRIPDLFPEREAKTGNSYTTKFYSVEVEWLDREGAVAGVWTPEKGSMVIPALE